MYKIDDNPCYRSGAIWKTRTRIHAYRELTKNQKPIVIPRGEMILLLGYVIRPSNEEHIHFLWNEQVWYAIDVDAGLQFIIDPNGINTQNKLLSRKKD